MIAIAKTFDFCSSHRLYRPDWNDEKNFEVYGKCSNPNGHGHNYRLEVIVSGTIDSEDGMVFDASKLDAIVQETILSEVDHKNLNEDVEWLSGKVPTAEAIVSAFWDRLDAAITAESRSATLHKLILHETARIYAVRTRE